MNPQSILHATLIDAIYRRGGDLYLSIRKARGVVIDSIRRVTAAADVPPAAVYDMAERVARAFAPDGMRWDLDEFVRAGMWKAADGLQSLSLAVNDATCAIAEVCGADRVATLREQMAEARLREELGEDDAAGVTIGGGS